SLSSSELFVRQWRAGELVEVQSGDSSEPVWAGAIGDLYTLYERFCRRHGERHVETLTLFSKRLARAGMHKRRRALELRDGSGKPERLRLHRCYWFDDKVPEG